MLSTANIPQMNMNIMIIMPDLVIIQLLIKPFSFTNQRARLMFAAWFKWQCKVLKAVILITCWWSILTHWLVHVNGIFKLQSEESIYYNSQWLPHIHCCTGTIWRAAIFDKHPTSLWWLQQINGLKPIWMSFECHWYGDYVYSHQLWIGDIWAKLPQSPNAELQYGSLGTKKESNKKADLHIMGLPHYLSNKNYLWIVSTWKAL